MRRALRTVPMISLVALSLGRIAAAAPELAAKPAANAAIGTPLLQPSTLVLIGLGLVGLAVFRARFRDEK